MSEQDFYTLRGNQYRGSRYANFAGAGVDPQGNVSSAVNENASNLSGIKSQNANQPVDNNGTSAEITPNIANKAVSQGLMGSPSVPTVQGAVKDLAIGGAIPFAATTIGSNIGANVASGAGFGEAVQRGISALGNKVSGGLLGTAGGPTNAALSSMGGKFGPATQSAVGKATGGSAFGGAAGTGLGTAAATLLTGGSVKEAAASGIGSAIGYALGNAILPGVGGFIGSTLGSMAGGLIKSDPGRNTIGVKVGLDKTTGKYSTSKVSTKNAPIGSAKKYGNSIAEILNNFGQATGIKYTSNYVNSETNVGSKDQGTFSGKTRVSSKPGDAGAIAFNVLKDRNQYTVGNDTEFNTFWDDALASSKSITDLGKRVDSFTASRGLMSSPSQAQANQNVAFIPSQREKQMSFYG